MLADVTAVLMVVFGIFGEAAWTTFWGLVGAGVLIWIHVTRRKAAPSSEPTG